MIRKTKSHQRIDESFIKEMEEIKVDRINSGKDNVSKPLSFREATGMLPRHNFWKQIKDEMKQLDRKVFNKKGGMFSIIWVVLLMVIIAIAGLALVVFASVWNYGFNEVTEAVQNTGGTAASNISYYGGTVVFGNLNIGFQQLEWISYFLIFGMVLGMFIGMFVIREHPAFFALYSIFALVGIIFAIFIARTYESLYLDGGILGTQLKSWGGSSWVLLNLPIWITVLAFVGAILMFVIFNRDPEQGSIS